MAKKIVKIVTVTGADDSVRPEQLITIVKCFPFVEFGILLSKEQRGDKKFPSRDWLEKLYVLWRKEKFALSGHLCGNWVKDLCLGKPNFFHEFGYTWEMFGRLQLNFHAKPHPVRYEQFGKALERYLDQRPVIFQMDGENEDKFYAMEGWWGVNLYPLFDLSGGCGVLPKEWPKQFDRYCGYAGGLSPENIQNELKRIGEVANGPIWIDTETWVRSEDNKLFKLRKVCSFLEAVRPWVIN